MTADVLPSPEQGGVRSGSFTVHNLANGEINKSVTSSTEQTPGYRQLLTLHTAAEAGSLNGAGFKQT